jgi:hypothetical protein
VACRPAAVAGGVVLCWDHAAPTVIIIETAAVRIVPLRRFRIFTTPQNFPEYSEIHEIFPTPANTSFAAERHPIRQTQTKLDHYPKFK